MTQKPVLLSGIQPTGNMHIGNYLGAFKACVDLQNSGKYFSILSVVDYHALTGNNDAIKRRENILNMCAELLAIGVDPEKSIFFIQSAVPEHTELAWIFNTVTPVAELFRMTQFKDKSERQEKNINTGLLTYPTLMAADILLYNTNFVPAGADQAQHIELTNEIARWFNNRYGEHFNKVEHYLSETPKIMSLLDPEKKMSKSLGENHVIQLQDSPEIITAKLKKAVTASTPGTVSPGVANLLLMLKEFNSPDYTRFVEAEQNGTIKYSELKSVTAEVIINYFAEFREKRAEFLANKKKLIDIMEEGVEKARAIAKKNMEVVRELIGVKLK